MNVLHSILEFIERNLQETLYNYESQEEVNNIIDFYYLVTKNVKEIQSIDKVFSDFCGTSDYMERDEYEFDVGDFVTDNSKSNLTLNLHAIRGQDILMYTFTFESGKLLISKKEKLVSQHAELIIDENYDRHAFFNNSGVDWKTQIIKRRKDEFNKWEKLYLESKEEYERVLAALGEEVNNN